MSTNRTVHDLQRAIHNGPVRAKHGRSHDGVTAISGALTLLTNIVMAWNTSQMQRVTDARPVPLEKAALARVAPVAYAHVNMRGMFNFSLGAMRRRSIEPATQARVGQA